MPFAFDPNHKVLTATLPPADQARLEAHIAARRAERLNVQFIDKYGQRDEWSFATEQARDRFIERLQDEGRAFAISTPGPRDLFDLAPRAA